MYWIKRVMFGDEGSKWDGSKRGRTGGRKSRALRLAFLRRMKKNEVAVVVVRGT